MLKYHPLTIAELRPEASDALCIGLAVPQELREAYRFLPGQHVGLRALLDGKEMRRTYSICSAIGEEQLRIGVRLQERGRMSQYLARQLRIGDRLDVLTPTGRFFVTPDPAAARSYVAFAAGSGITPILGILRNVLSYEPASRFSLFYGNRTAASIMFAEELLALKDRYPERLALSFLLSREPQDIELFNGRLDAQKTAQLAQGLFDPTRVDAFFLCGPGTMIESVQGALLGLGVDSARIHFERFTTEGVSAPDVDRVARASEVGADPAGARVPGDAAASTQVTVVMDGRRRAFSMTRGGQTVLEAAEEAGLELPYSCRAGVCSTCRTRVVRGAVTMTANYALEPWELESGYVLCCQALPTTDELEINYDER